MTQRYSTLQTKLQELESILNDALLRGPDAYSHEDIKQKLAFIGNLLSAEVASHPSKPHHHLQHISQRLAALEKAFHEWDTLRTFSSFEEFDKDSTCSCTESCLNDDGEALDETELIVFEDPEKLFPDFVGEKAIVEFRGGGVEASGVNETGKINVGIDKMGSFVFEDAQEDFLEDLAGDKGVVEFDGCLLGKQEEEERKDNELEREEERRNSAFGKNCCALAGGVVIGMILMGFIVVNLSGCFHCVEQTSFAIPT